MNYTLLIDTSSSLKTAVFDAEGSVKGFQIAESPRASHKVAALAESCLTESGAGFADISAGIVCRGPGSFTGLRIGIAFMEGLCFPQNLPIYAYSSLEAMLAGQPPGTAAVLPARKGYWYYSLKSETQDRNEEKVMSTPDLVEQSRNCQSLVIYPSDEGKAADLKEKFACPLTLLDKDPAWTEIYQLALALPAMHGIIKPNYIQQSAAELNLKLAENS